MIKGYSRAVDSARIIHAFAAFNLELNVRSWFEYVPSKDNIADEPSRGEFERLARLGSTEVEEVILPDIAAWDEPADKWMQRAVEAAGPDPERQMRPGAIGRVLIGHVAKSRHLDNAIRIDRSSGAALGDPFPIRSGVTREGVCEACSEVIEDTMALAANDEDEEALERAASAVQRAAASRGWALTEEQQEADQELAARARAGHINGIATRLVAGADVQLLCWCYPRRCHGQDVAKACYARARQLSFEARPRRKRRKAGEGGGAEA